MQESDKLNLEIDSKSHCQLLVGNPNCPFEFQIGEGAMVHEFIVCSIVLFSHNREVPFQECG